MYRNGNQIINIAVLEFKNTQVMHLADFSKAMANQGNAKSMRDSSLVAVGYSHFKRNALLLSKQARKYSKDLHILATLAERKHFDLFYWAS